MTRLRHATIVALALLLSGCSALQINSTDSGPQKAAKAIGRVALCVASFCFSEMEYSMIRQGYSDEQRQQFWAGVTAAINRQNQMAMGGVNTTLHRD